MSRGGDIFCDYCDEDVDIDLADNIRISSRGRYAYVHVRCLDSYNAKMSRTCIVCDQECDGEITILVYGEENPVHSDCVPCLQRHKLMYTMELLLTALENFIKRFGHPNDLRAMEKRYEEIVHSAIFSFQDAKAFIRDLHEMMSGDL